MLTHLAAATSDSLDAAADNGWSAVGVIGGAAVMAIAMLAYKLLSRWMTTHSEIQVGDERYDVTGMSPALVRMLDVALNRATAAEADAKAAREENAAHELRIRGLEETNGQLSQENQTLVLWARPTIDWIDRGAEPPPPAVPDELRRLTHPPTA